MVVENLAIMQLCHSWRFPAIDNQALWVYRGDYKTGATASTCRDFVARFGTGKTVIVFSDMGPKGLEIALTMPHAEYWLGPGQSDWRQCLKSKQASREGFDLQSAALTYLGRLSGEGKLAPAICQLVEYLNTERSSFRQEHMSISQLGMELFPLFLTKQA